MRWLGLGLMVVGVGIGAAFAARNGADMVQREVDKSATIVMDRALAAARVALAKENKLDDPKDVPDADVRAKAAAALAKDGLIPSADAFDARYEAATAQVEGATTPAPGARIAQWFAAGGLGWVLGVGLVILGAVLARRAGASGAEDGDAGAGAVTFDGALDALEAGVDAAATAIADLKMGADAPEVRRELDALRDTWITPVVDRRQELINRFGIGPFGQFFGPFSGVERSLNRAWSALTDQHPPAAREALVDARRELAAARAAYRGIMRTPS